MMCPCSAQFFQKIHDLIHESGVEFQVLLLLCSITYLPPSFPPSLFCNRNADTKSPSIAFLCCGSVGWDMFLKAKVGPKVRLIVHSLRPCPCARHPLPCVLSVTLMIWPSPSPLTLSSLLVSLSLALSLSLIHSRLQLVAFCPAI